jgi:hypothetical protein
VNKPIVAGNKPIVLEKERVHTDKINHELQEITTKCLQYPRYLLNIEDHTSKFGALDVAAGNLCDERIVPSHENLI